MSITVNLRYTGTDGNARKFAEEMISSGTVDAIRAEEGILLLKRQKQRNSLSDNSGDEIDLQPGCDTLIVPLHPKTNKKTYVLG